MKKIEKLEIPNKITNSYYKSNPQQFDILFDIVSNNLRKYTIILRSNKYFRTLVWIYVQTQMLDDIDATLKTRIYWIFHDIHDYPICKNPNCSHKLGEIQNIADGYNKGYCSNHCAQTDLEQIAIRQLNYEHKHGKGIACPQKRLDVRKKISSKLLNRSEAEKEYTNELLRQSWKNKSKERINQIVNQRKQTSLDKYGVEVASQTLEARQHLSKIMSSQEMQSHMIAVKKKNGTINSSKLEEDSYKLLCTKFSTEDIIHQYRSEKYPFNCDFYIKSFDLYIECNFNWTHGGHWYDPLNENDQNTLKKWQDKGTDFYKNAINTWTVRDVNKHQIAIDNNLNYLVFWKLSELESWLSSFTINHDNEQNINESK